MGTHWQWFYQANLRVFEALKVLASLMANPVCPLSMLKHPIILTKIFQVDSLLE